MFDDEPLLRHLRRVCKGRVPKTSASASKRSIAGPADAPLHVLPHYGSATRGRGAIVRGAAPVDRPRPAQRDGFSRLIADDSDADGLDNLAFDYQRRQPLSLLPMPTRGCCSPTTKQTPHGSPAPHADDGTTYSRTRSTVTSSTARAAINPAQCGTKAGCEYKRGFPPGARRSCGCGSPTRSSGRSARPTSIG